jgi:hypothetical protein
VADVNRAWRFPRRGGLSRSIESRRDRAGPCALGLTAARPSSPHLDRDRSRGECVRRRPVPAAVVLRDRSAAGSRRSSLARQARCMIHLTHFSSACPTCGAGLDGGDLRSGRVGTGGWDAVGGHSLGGLLVVAVVASTPCLPGCLPLFAVRGAVAAARASAPPRAATLRWIRSTAPRRVDKPVGG